MIFSKFLNDCNTDAVFALYCEAGICAIACVLAILRNGAFFYLSGELTENELINIVKNVPIKLIVVQKKYYSKVPCILNPVICTNIQILDDDFLLIRINFSDVNYKRETCFPPSYPLAYIICTSGSTGFPKLVYVPHKCIVPNIKDFQATFKITSKDIILSTSPLYFDPSVVDIFLGISYGARVIIVSPDILKKANHLEQIIKINPISFIQITPALFRTISLSLFQELRKSEVLKAIALGGEMFPSQTNWTGWVDLDSKIKVYNLYGLTELSCWASCHEVDIVQYMSSSPSPNSDLSVPIGRPLTGVEIYLNDEYGNKILKGEGNIVITGERNVCRITDHNSAKESCGFTINTGDIGYTDGVNIYCIGRRDDVVKRNSCKISLSEIEMASKFLKGVSESCAVYHENKISLFVTASSSYILTEKLLLIHLKKYLSSWKLPDQVFIIRELPLSRNYKVDKQSLLRMSCNIGTQLQPFKVFTEPKSVKSIIKELWEDFVGSNSKENDNFIDVGGNSFQAVQLAERIQLLIVYDNPIILQTILNGTFQDVCCLVSKGSKMHIQESCLTNERNETLKNENVLTDVEGNHTMDIRKSCQGGHYIYEEEIASFLSNNKFEIMWTTYLHKCIDSSPLVVQCRNELKIFIGSHSHYFFCVDNDGKIIWRAKLPDRIEGSACLSKKGDAVYVGCYDGRLYCFQPNDGKVLWTIQTQGKIKSTCTLNPVNGYIIFGSYDKHLYCCDELGNLKWKTKLSNGCISAASVIANECVFTGTLDGYITCLRTCGGSLTWKKFIGKPIFSSLAVCSVGVIFGCTDNFIYCVSFDSKVIWKYETGGPIFSSPSVLEHKFANIIGIGSHDNSLHFIDTNGSMIAVHQGTSPIYSTPFIVLKDSKTLYAFAAETNGIIYSIEFKKTKETWKQISIHRNYLNDKIFSSPVYYNGKIYIGCRNNMLYCLTSEVTCK